MAVLLRLRALWTPASLVVLVTLFLDDVGGGHSSMVTSGLELAQ